MCVHARLLAEESFSRAPRGEDSFSLAGKVGARLAKPERSDQKGVQKKTKQSKTKNVNTCEHPAKGSVNPRPRCVSRRMRAAVLK